jgi:hypothetical protein
LNIRVSFLPKNWETESEANYFLIDPVWVRKEVFTIDHLGQRPKRGAA